MSSFFCTCGNFFNYIFKGCKQEFEEVTGLLSNFIELQELIAAEGRLRFPKWEIPSNLTEVSKVSAKFPRKQSKDKPERERYISSSEP